MLLEPGQRWTALASAPKLPDTCGRPARCDSSGRADRGGPGRRISYVQGSV